MKRQRFSALAHLCAVTVAVLCFAIAGASNAHAQAPSLPLASPTGPVVLSIGGNLQNTNRDRQADFDMAMLMALPSVHIYTTTPWTEGVTRFDGVPVEALLRHVAVQGAEAEFVALNDYAVRARLQDFSKYPAIIAYHMNAKPMSVRDKGPLWLIFPMDDYPELRTTFYRDRMIWQLRSIEVK